MITQALTITRAVHFRQGRGTRKVLAEGEQLEAAAPPARVPRVSRLMALAIRLGKLIQEGQVADQADIAALGHVTRARVSQIMNLLNLAPDIQEEILFLPPVERGRDPVRERNIRPIASVLDWRKQRKMWAAIRSSELSKSR
jgi:hypothetical protein